MKRIFKHPYIGNGRIRGDSLGRLTQWSVLGSRVVDYAITDTEPQDINKFTVSPQQPLSDHSQISEKVIVNHCESKP